MEGLHSLFVHRFLDCRTAKSSRILPPFGLMISGSHTLAKAKNCSAEQAVHRVIQHFSHPISAADISREFAEGKKPVNIA
jgi:hypothetical protein